MAQHSRGGIPRPLPQVFNTPPWPPLLKGGKLGDNIRAGIPRPLRSVYRSGGPYGIRSTRARSILLGIMPRAQSGCA